MKLGGESGVERRAEGTVLGGPLPGADEREKGKIRNELYILPTEIGVLIVIRRTRSVIASRDRTSSPSPAKRRRRG